MNPYQQSIFRHKLEMVTLIEKVVAEGGCSIREACEVIGVSRKTYYRYRDSIEVTIDYETILKKFPLAIRLDPV